MKYFVIVAFVSSLILLQTAEAEITSGKGFVIARKAYQNHRELENSNVKISMTIQNRHGGTAVYNIRIHRLVVEEGVHNMLLIYEHPSIVRGTSLLISNQKGCNSDMWFYLSARRRVKRIRACYKSVPFMGSLWTYEDLEAEDVDKFTYKWTGEDTVNGYPCHVVECSPLDKKHSGYSRQVKWIDKDQYLIHKIEYYDRKESLLKILSLDNYQQYQGKYWCAREMTMVHHKTGKSMRIVILDQSLDVGLSARDFSRDRMASFGYSLSSQRQNQKGIQGAR